MRNSLAKIALLVGTLGLALAATEIALRAAGVAAPEPLEPVRLKIEGVSDPFVVPDLELFYRLRPDASFLGYYDINGYGWRGPEVSRAKPPKTFRIACLGDSCTIGLGVRQEDTWPAQLERLLSVIFAGTDTTFEVVNAGVFGYSTWQNRVQLERDVLPLQPDLVVVMPTGINDTSTTSKPSDRESTRHNRRAAGTSPTLHLAELVRDVLGSSESTAVRWSEGVREGLPIRRRVDADEFDDNLRAMAAMTREDGGELLLVAAPHRAGERTAQPEYVECEEAAVRIAAERGLPLADPRAVFASYEPHALFVDQVHPDADGCRWIALAIVEALLESDLLGDSPRREFLRAWRDARRRGVASSLADLDALADGAPPPLDELLAAYADDDFDERLRADDVRLPVSIRVWDPLHGARRDEYDEGALRWHAAREERADEATRLRSRAAAIRAAVTARDPFACFLFGDGLDPARRGPAEGVDPFAPRAVRWARALTVYERAIDATPLTVDRRIAQAALRERNDDVDGALALLDEVLALSPTCAPALHAKGNVLRRNGQAAEARECLQRAVELDPDSPASHTELGIMAMRRDRKGAAEASFRRALEIHALTPMANYLLAQLLLERDELDEARRLLETAAVSGRRAFPELAGQLRDIKRRQNREARQAERAQSPASVSDRDAPADS